MNVNVDTYKVSIKGIVPLMHHRYPIEENMDTSKKKKKVFNQTDDAERALYRDPQKNIYQPSTHLEGAMIKAAVQFKYVGRKTYKDIFKSSVFVLPERIPFKIPTNPELEPNGAGKIDVRPVIINRARVPAARPIWEDWAFDFEVRVLQSDLIDKDLLAKVLEYAGNFIGIGTFRPKFGRFTVTKLSKITTPVV